MALLGGFARAPRLHLLEALEIPPSAAPRRAGYRCPQRPPRAPAPRVAAGGTPPPKMAGGAASSARGRVGSRRSRYGRTKFGCT